MDFLKDLWGFLNKRKKFWLLPVIFILLGFGVPDKHHIETSVGGLAHALAAANQRLPPIPAISLGFSRTAARGALR